jgi:branched-chain amino acid transport system permease protein
MRSTIRHLVAGTLASIAIPAGMLTLVYAFVWLLGDPVMIRVGTELFVSAIVVMGLYSFIGTSGVVSFGHISFMAIGAYVGALLTIPPTSKRVMLPDLAGFLQSAELPTVAAALVAASAAAIFALVMAGSLMRLSGLAAGIATLAMLQIVFTVVRNWDAVTRGTGSMLGVPTNTTLESSFFWALAVLAVVSLFQRSRTGLRLQASREDPHAAQGVGINIFRARSAAFVLSAFIVGLGGFLYGQFLGVFSPDSFYLTLTFVTLAMLVVGGMTSLAGAVVGTIVISSSSEVLKRAEQGADITGLHEVGLSLMMLLFLILLPRGLTGGRELVVRSGLVDRLRRRRRSGGPTPARPATESDA